MKAKIQFIGRLMVVIIAFLTGIPVWTALVSATERQTLSYWEAFKIDWRFEANCWVHWMTKNYQLFIF